MEPTAKTPVLCTRHFIIKSSGMAILMATVMLIITGIIFGLIQLLRTVH